MCKKLSNLINRLNNDKGTVNKSIYVYGQAIHQNDNAFIKQPFCISFIGTTS